MSQVQEKVVTGDLIRRLGGASAIARWMRQKGDDITPQAVSQWITCGTIPETRADRVVELIAAYGLTSTYPREVLRVKPVTPYFGRAKRVKYQWDDTADDTGVLATTAPAQSSNDAASVEVAA